MDFWIHLDLELIGDRGENGWPPAESIERLLDRKGIENESNRDVAKQMLTFLNVGRNSGFREEQQAHARRQRRKNKAKK